jgi:hypothetical protein
MCEEKRLLIVLRRVFRSSELTHNYPFQKIVKSAFSGCDLDNDIGQLLYFWQ